MNVRRVAENYRTLCVSNDSNSSKFWDVVVLTASDDQQKIYYEGFLEARKRTGLLPFRNSCTYMVVADPPINTNNRIGGGGATFWTLAGVKTELQKKGYSGDIFSKVKVLMIHSGGYSSRNPNLAATGKIFSPIPSFIFPGLTVPTLFDFKMAQYAPIAEKCSPGLMVMAGDVCEVFDPFVECFSFVQEGCFAIGHLDSYKYAANHGVYVVESNDFGFDKAMKCKQYCHKFESNELNKVGANLSGVVGGVEDLCIVDSDYFLSANIVTKLISYYEASPGILSLGVEIDCYGDFLSCFKGVESDEHSNRIKKCESPTLKNIRMSLWSILKDETLFVVVPKQQTFYHIGTMTEYSNYLSKGMKELLYGDIEQNETNGERVIASNVKGDCSIGQSAILSSTLHSTRVGNGSVIEFSSILASPSGTSHIVGDNCILSGIFHSRDIPLNIPSNLLIVTYPLKHGCVTFIFGTGDDMKKKPITDWGGKEWDYEAITKATNLSHIDQVACDLFSVPIFPVCNDPCDSLLMSLAMFCNVQGEKHGTGEAYMKYVEDRNVLYYTSLKEAAKYKSVKRLTAIRAPPPGVCLQAAVLRLMGTPLAFEGVKKSSHVELPARLVIAGGWTDTPPQCLMSPGGVFNIAITVNGKYPIQASVTPIRQENVLELVSEDQKVTETFSSWDELYQNMELDSAMGLHKVCVAVLFDKNLRHQLGHHVQAEEDESLFPCGFRLSTRSFLPKGSGLGASSILALAIVRALKESCNLNMSQDKEMNVVLSIEQVLGSGGGWQDQIGTLSGCKLTSLESSGYNVRKVEMDAEHTNFLNDRLVCLCTDITRVAQKVLIGVIDKYNAGYSNIVNILMSELPTNATAMKLAFDYFAKVDLEDMHATEKAIALIGQQLSVYRKCCEGLEGNNFLPDSIAKVVNALQLATYGCNLMGAGSGGFLLAVRKENWTREEILNISTSVVSTCPDLKLTLTEVNIV